MDKIKWKKEHKRQPSVVESRDFVSPLRSGVFPLRRLRVVVDKVHAVVGVHAPLCGAKFAMPKKNRGTELRDNMSGNFTKPIWIFFFFFRRQTGLTPTGRQWAQRIILCRHHRRLKPRDTGWLRDIQNTSTIPVWSNTSVNWDTAKRTTAQWRMRTKYHCIPGHWAGSDNFTADCLSIRIVNSSSSATRKIAAHIKVPLRQVERTRTRAFQLWLARNFTLIKTGWATSESKWSHFISDEPTWLVDHHGSFMYNLDMSEFLVDLCGNMTD